MRHQIGLNYSEVLKARKGKRELPSIGRLKFKCDIERLRAQMNGLIAENHEQLAREEFAADLASSEHSYQLNDSRGQPFIKNYDEFYRRYSMIGFQSLSASALDLAARTEKKVSDFTPTQRLRGMTDTTSRYYHPHYDERNYTTPTAFCRDYISEVLNGFRAESSRSALVVLRPGQYVNSHFDIGPEYVTRLMIPVQTNFEARVGVFRDGVWSEFFLPADGHAYFINAGFLHYAINSGAEDRYQVRVCLNGQEDLEGMEAMEPVRTFSAEEFRSHPCSGEHHSESNQLRESLREFRLEKSGSATLD